MSNSSDSEAETTHVVASQEEEQETVVVASKEAEETVPVVEDCSNSDVVTKYRLAAEIVNTALQGVMTQCLPGKSIVEVCKFGDAIIEKRCAAIFKSKKVDKGIAFPTCVSVNEIVCHNSPLPAESGLLAAGDWVKIDLGCHIDGYIAMAAHTIIVAEEGSDAAAAENITGPKADVLMAGHDALEACVRLIKPGNKNTDVTKVLEKIAQAYGVNAVQGTIMHQMKRFVIDANKTIAPKSDAENKVPTCEFEANEVYTIDVAFTTGAEKAKESEGRTTVFKRIVDKNYRLKMKASRYVFSEINTKYPTLPFTVRSFEDERQARMGVVECVKHGLLQPYPILIAKSGDHLVHLKATVLLLPSGTVRITGLTLPLDQIKSEKKVDEETAALLAVDISKKEKTRTNKKKKKSKTAKPEPADDEE